MEESNLYKAPEADVTAPSTGEAPLAGRGARLLGFIIDSVILLAVAIPLMFLLGFFDPDSLQTTPFLVDQLGGAALSMIVFLLIHGYFLVNRGQSLGKMVVGTRIVSVQDDRIVGPGRVIGLRYVLPQFIMAIPFLGAVFGLVNVLFIFGSERRCIHDYIAGTRVVLA